MVNKDNVIPFPAPTPKTLYIDLEDTAVYRDRESLVTACYCYDCEIVHICGYQCFDNEWYEMLEELDEGDLLGGDGVLAPIEDHIDLVVGRLNRRQGRVSDNPVLLP